jgi:hypothetical protein
LKKPMIRRMGFHLSLLAVILLVAAPMPVAAQSATSAMSADQPLSSAERTWLDLNTPKALRATTDPEVWTVVAVGNEKAVEPFASVRILSSIDLAAPTGKVADALAQTSYTLVSRKVVVASVVGDSNATRDALYLAAVVMDFGVSYVDRDGYPIQSFVPVFVSHSLDLASEIAKNLAAEDNGQTAVDQRSATGTPSLEFRCGCEEACDAEFQTDNDLCFAESALCITLAGAAAAACILACPPCAPACLAAEVAAEGLCLVQQTQCIRAARAANRACIHDCIIIP